MLPTGNFPMESTVLTVALYRNISKATLSLGTTAKQAPNTSTKAKPKKKRIRLKPF